MEKVKVPQRLEVVIERLKTYLTCHKFINALVWKSIYKQTIAAVGMGGIGVLTQATAFASAVTYAKWLNSGKIVQLGAYSIEARKSLGLLFIVGLAVSLCWLINGWLQFSSEKKFLEIQRKVEEALASLPLRLLEERVHNPKDILVSSVPLDAAILLRARFRDTKYVALSFKQALSCILPIATFCTASIALLHLNPVFSIAVFAIIFLTSAPLMAINIQGAKATTGVEDAAKMARKAMIFESTRLSGFALKSDDVNVRSALDNYRTNYYERILSIERASFVSSATTSLVFLVIIVSLGAMIISAGNSWGQLGVFLTAIHFCLSNFKTLVRRTASINRFFPYLRRYQMLIDNIKSSEKPSLQRKLILKAPKDLENVLILSGGAEPFLTFSPKLIRGLHKILGKDIGVHKVIYPFRKRVVQLQGETSNNLCEFNMLLEIQKSALSSESNTHLLISTGYVPKDIGSFVKQINDAGRSVILLTPVFKGLENAMSSFARTLRLTEKWDIIPFTASDIQTIKDQDLLLADDDEQDIEI